MKNFGQRSWDIRIYGRAPTAKLLLNRVILKSLRKSDRDLVTFNDVSMCALNRCEAVCQPGDDTHAIDAGDGRVEGPPSNLRAVQRIGIGWAGVPGTSHPSRISNADESGSPDTKTDRTAGDGASANGGASFADSSAVDDRSNHASGRIELMRFVTGVPDVSRTRIRTL